MANFIYNSAAKEMWDGTIDVVNDTLKLMLVDDTYVANRDDDYVDEGGTHDAIDAEIDLPAAGYVKGWGNSGRHALTAIQQVTVDKVNDRAEFDAGDPSTWSSIGPSGIDIHAAILIKEGGADDTTSRLIAYIDTVNGTPSLPFTPTGGNFTLQISAEGLLHLKTVV